MCERHIGEDGELPAEMKVIPLSSYSSLDTDVSFSLNTGTNVAKAT